MTEGESLLDWMRARLDLPEGQLAAIAAVQTSGDYLNFHPHPHLHVLAGSGLVDRGALPCASGREPRASY